MGGEVCGYSRELWMIKEQVMITGSCKKKSFNISSSVIILLYAFLILVSGISAGPASAGYGTGVWVSETVDSAGVVGWDTSVAVDSTGKVHISYYDASNGALKHAINASGIWVIETVDSVGDVGWYSSIAIDSAGKVHIGYYDAVNGDLKHATDASGTWVPVIIDGAGNRGKHASLAIDNSDKVHIGYYDTDNGDLRYATNASGVWVSGIIVDSAGDVGWDTSVAVDSTGKVHISYYDADNGDLKYATNASGPWVSEPVDSVGDVGWDTSAAVDSFGKVHISYYDADNANLKHAAGSSGTWVTEAVDSDGDIGVFTSLFIDSSGTVRIGYHDYTNKTLKYATNIYGTWMVETVDSSGDVGTFVSITGDPVGNAHISYYDQQNGDLKYAIKGVVGTLRKGFNFISAPANTNDIPDAHTFLGLIAGNDKNIKKILRYDKANGNVQEAFYNPDGSIGGINFSMAAGEGIIVYALEDMEIEVPNNTCPLFDLKAGTNWAGTPCKLNNTSAWSMLQSIGSSNAISIQQFNPVTGRFESAGFLNGQTVGVDFPLDAGKGYFINMIKNLSGYSP